MELKISEIKPNPFKRFINEGKLNPENVAKMEESIEHGTLPEYFTVRKKDDSFELCFGHHRLQALSNKKGKDYKVNVNLVSYSDEQMLVDLVRENLSQRDTGFHDTEDSVVLARSWLTSGATSVKQFYTCFKDGRKSNAIKGKEKFQESPDSYRSIAKFISKNGKTISHETIKNYLDIRDNLAPEIHDKIIRAKGKSDKEGRVSFTLALLLSRFKDKQEQKDLLKAIQKEDVHAHKISTALTKYKETDEPTKELVRTGRMKLIELNSNPKSVFEIEDEQAQKEISFEKQWEQDCNKYAKDMLLWHNVSLKDFPKARIQRYQKMLKDNQAQEIKLFDYFEKKFKGDEQ